jgi:hypothetical protein
MGALVKLQCRETMLAINDQEIFLRILQTANAAAIFPRSNAISAA